MFSKVLDSCYVLIVFIQIGEYIMIRRRRLRATENLRALVRETSVSVSDLIYPLLLSKEMISRIQLILCQEFISIPSTV